jgi:TRAP-type C4-dicarboxylate transport system substrate-binding protein
MTLLLLLLSTLSALMGGKHMHKKYRNTLFAASVAFVSGFASFAQAADELVISSATPPQHIQTLTMTAFADALIERSGGSLKAKVFDSSQLYNARDVGKAVARGDVGMATVPSPYLSRVEPNINVLDLPILKGMTADQRSAMLDGPVGEILNEKLSAKMGVIVPGNWPVLGKVYYWSTSKPLTNFDEFVGLQIRIPGGAGPAAVVEGMGGIPVVMPGSDMPLALQQGTVDGTMASIESVVQQKLTDVGIRYGFWDQGIIGFLIPVVSQKYWSSLTEDERELFTSVWNDIVDEQRVSNKAVDADMRKTLEGWGVTISDASVEAASAIREQMMPQQKKVIEKYRLDETLVKLATEASK